MDWPARILAQAPEDRLDVQPYEADGVSLDRSIDPLERTVGFPKRQMHVRKAGRDGGASGCSRHRCEVDHAPVFVNLAAWDDGMVAADNDNLGNVVGSLTDVERRLVPPARRLRRVASPDYELVRHEPSSRRARRLLRPEHLRIGFERTVPAQNALADLTGGFPATVIGWSARHTCDSRQPRLQPAGPPGVAPQQQQAQVPHRHADPPNAGPRRSGSSGRVRGGS
jgi:hypothetical protein